ncbi:respiratory nitrate reductase subunit gamma [Streptomyces sp. Lzd4kr]|nr:respiratory nitrate reductase subunit gamma [Streptomyces sp. Lzd4kr]
MAHDLVATPLQHDTPGEAPPDGPTAPQFTLVERDYTAIADRIAVLGPLAEEQGMTVKGVTVRPTQEAGRLAARCGTATRGPARGRPLVDTDVKLCEAILALSGTTNGRLAAEGFERLADRAVYPLLACVLLAGLTATATTLRPDSYDYRLGVSVWFRSLLVLDPNVPAMSGAPFAYQLHALLGMALFALWPFSRLVHAFTAPLGYPARPYVVHRSRGARRTPSAHR